MAMTEERWRVLSDLLDQALDLPEADRALWLKTLADRDPEVAAALAEILSAGQTDHFKEFLAGSVLPPVEQLPAATLIGRQVGPYLIDSEVGRGGMGSVWRAHRTDGRYDGVVAIKFVNAMWIGQSGEQRFHLEGSALGRLNHPNIARLLDAGVFEASQPYLILEFVEGEAIDEYCKRNKLGIEARIGLFLSVVQAVAHAHSHLIVHRDLKPGNVFVTKEGIVKLLDFGIAKLLDDEGSAALTRAGGLALTPQYAAPEQLLGQPITTATDVYALGLLLYVLLTGKQPFADSSNSSADLVREVTTVDLPRASTVASLDTVRGRDLKGDLDNILRKATKKVPAERYASADAFAEDLKHHLADERVLARPDSMAYRATKFFKRHPLGTSLASFAVLAIAASLLATAIQSRRATQAAHQAIAERARADDSARRAREERDLALEGVAEAQDLTELTSFLLGEALPEGRPDVTEAVLLRGVGVVRDSRGVPLQRRAEMMELMGGEFEDRRDYNRAHQLFTEATQMADSAGDVAISARASCHVGMIEAYMGHSVEGLAKVDTALARLPQTTATADPRIVCYLAKNEVLGLQGKSGLEEAEAAQRTLADLLVPNRYFEHAILGQLTAAYTRGMRVPEAQRAYAREEQLNEDAGWSHERNAMVHFSNQGMFFWKIGRPLDARASLERSQAINRERGATDIDYPLALLLKARIARQLGDMAEAMAGYARALQHARELHDYPAEAAIAGEEISALRDGGAYARAQRQLPITERWLHTQYPDSHWIFGVLRMESALLAEHNGDAARARSLADEAIILFETKSPVAYQFPIALVDRAGIELRQKDYEAASADVTRALAIYDRTFGKDLRSESIGDALMMRGRIASARGDAAAAREDFSTAARHFEASVGGDNVRTKDARALAGL
jgi:tetratricopeptide (TPR) repeat protein